MACSDSDNPGSYAAWSAAGAASDEQFGYFGRIWTWASSICADWLGADADRYMGPFDHRTGSPVLVVGNLFDPATRYAGALTAHGLLPSSSLLTVHGWGHTSLFLSACADQAIGRYLVDVTTPAPGTVCEQDAVPFAQSLLAPSASAGALAAGRQSARCCCRTPYSRLEVGDGFRAGGWESNASERDRRAANGSLQRQSDVRRGGWCRTDPSAVFTMATRFHDG